MEKNWVILPVTSTVLPSTLIQIFGSSSTSTSFQNKIRAAIYTAFKIIVFDAIELILITL